jgi:hypothetical protein
MWIKGKQKIPTIRKRSMPWKEAWSVKELFIRRGWKNGLSL